MKIQSMLFIWMLFISFAATIVSAVMGWNTAALLSWVAFLLLFFYMLIMGVTFNVSR